MTQRTGTSRSTRLPRAFTALCFAVCMTMGALKSATATSTIDRISVTEVKPLLMQAAAQGEAHGILGGPGADYVRRKFDATTPIEIDVRRLQTLPQAGCGRLEVTTRQRNVIENGTRQDEVLTYQLSFCSDGRFPEQSK
jgi:hypothetical protein